MSDHQKRLNREFSALFKEVDRIIAPLIDSIDVREISKFNRAYEAYSVDKFKHFVEVEKRRYYNALDLIVKDGIQTTVCDLGCFIPYLPVALSLVGYKVKIVEKYEFYGNAFKNSLARVAKARSIEIYDLDILNDDLQVLGNNDVVLLMAVVEHLNGSPRKLLEKIRSIISKKGILIFEAPNIAEFTKRLKLLLGISPMAEYASYFDSEYPFIGHNREMTVDEVVYMLRRGGFDIELLLCYDCYRQTSLSIKGRFAKLLKSVVPIKNKGQTILAKARPCDHSVLLPSSRESVHEQDVTNITQNR